MGQRHVGEIHRLSCGCFLPEMPGLVRKLPEREDPLDLSVHQERVEPSIAITDQARVSTCFSFGASIDAVQVRVDEHIAARDAELGKQSLNTPPGFAYETATHHNLMLRGILPDDEHARGAVETPAVKDRSPLDAKLVGGVYVCFGVVGAQG